MNKHRGSRGNSTRRSFKSENGGRTCNGRLIRRLSVISAIRYLQPNKRNKNKTIWQRTKLNQRSYCISHALKKDEREAINNLVRAAETSLKTSKHDQNVLRDKLPGSGGYNTSLRGRENAPDPFSEANPSRSQRGPSACYIKQ